MERAAHALYTELAAKDDVALVKWGGSNKWLPMVYPWLLIKTLWMALSWRPDVIYIQDGNLAPLGWLAKTLSRKPTLITIHGLDITYKNKLFQAIVPPLTRRQTAIVAVSEGTRQAVQQRLPGALVSVVPNGVEDMFYLQRPRERLLESIAAQTGLSLEQLTASKLLLTTGRLVRRKGVAWFVDEVLPGLVKANPAVLYLVCGAGKQRAAIERAVAAHQLEKHVKLLGLVDDELVKELYNAADIFVMPNVPTPGNVEGFGLVAVEAASCGTLVVAADLEGIRDAIQNDQNGYLVEPKNSAVWQLTLSRLLQEPTLRAAGIRNFTLQHYSWEKASEAYRQIMRTLTDAKVK